MKETKRRLKFIKVEIELNKNAVITREKIQKAENEKELEMLDKFEKWIRDLEGLLDKELEE